MALHHLDPSVECGLTVIRGIHSDRLSPRNPARRRGVSQRLAVPWESPVC